MPARSGTPSSWAWSSTDQDSEERKAMIMSNERQKTYSLAREQQRSKHPYNQLYSSADWYLTPQREKDNNENKWTNCWIPTRLLKVRRPVSWVKRLERNCPPLRERRTPDRGWPSSDLICRKKGELRERTGYRSHDFITYWLIWLIISAHHIKLGLYFCVEIAASVITGQ